MRLKKITLENFRCYSDQEIDLSADVIVIYGRNGVGKTAVFDGIEVALLGSIGRISEDVEAPDYLSKVQTDKSSRVRLDLDGGLWAEARWGHGAMMHAGFASSHGANRTNFIYEHLLDASASPRREIAVAREFFRSVVLLSQATLQDFLTSSPEDRGRVVSYLTGSGYLRRCMEKADAVVALAEGEARRRTAARSGTEVELKEVQDQIAQREARLAELRKALREGPPATFDGVRASLDAAGIRSADLTDEPRTEDVEALVHGVVAACDERRQLIEQTLSGLSQIATGLGQFLTQSKRRRELLELRDRTNEKIESLLHAENKASENITRVGQEHAELLGRESRTRRRIERAPGLATDLKAAEERLATSMATRTQLGERTAAARAEAAALTQELSEAQAERDTTKVKAEGLRLQVQAMESLVSRNPAYRTAVEESAKLREHISDLHAKVAPLAQERDRLSAAVHERRQKVEDLSQAVSRCNNERQRRAGLLAALRDHVQEPKCPLCGHVHESLDETLQAIDRQLAETTEGGDGPSRQLIAEEKALAEEQRSLQQIESQLQRMEDEIGGCQADLKRQSDVANAFEMDAAALGVSAADDHVHVLSERRGEIQAVTSDLSEAECRLAELSAKGETLRAFIGAQGGALAELEHEVDRAREARDVVLNQIKDADVSDLVTLPQDALQRELASLADQLRAQEAAVREAATRRSSQEAHWSAVRQERMRLEAGVQEWKETLGSLDEEVQAFSYRLRAAGLDDGVTEEAIQSRGQAAESSRDALLAAIRVIDEYGRHRRVAQLQAERDALRRTEQDLVHNSVSLREEEVKLKDASRTAKGWTSVLACALGNRVEARLRYFQDEISNRFRAMVPDSALFEGIEVSRQANQVSLGLRYSGVGAVGEPVFFLSSAQANVLALATFLSFACSQSWSRLSTILMDDPVQHLDDIDAVAFLDLLRAVSIASSTGERRQIVLSTCDKELYLLVIRKFLALNRAGRLSLTGISLLDGGAEGPQVVYDIGGPGNVLPVNAAV